MSLGISSLIQAAIPLIRLSNFPGPALTFKYIQSRLTHLPFELTEDCEISSAVRQRERDKVRELEHAPVLKPFQRQAICSIRSVIKWIDWLRHERVYDNTKLIIVSDHGFSTRANAALLVKDFDQRGPLRIDDLFLTNADTPAIVCNAIESCEGVMEDPTKNSIPDRVLLYSEGH